MAGAFEDYENLYIVLDLATGGNLYQKMKRRGKFNENTVKSYMSDVLKAVAYLHSKKPAILHRDLKPENILICG